ncbi:methyltransferase domain-containing protein [Colletotrichum navitas]|uniref:Methyltransferase domain-containing protein n=1 Tax=Colletotrichum navitas TaxID=681940 RepID=A0AAD8PRJ3_9PEZI|nr:methyltransferase domain-containing protein [Colletotrichum navitas]KAK1574593.1 methyltransferase domain-containing protein [Colletotrichum navitas]
MLHSEGVFIYRAVEKRDRENHLLYLGSNSLTSRKCFSFFSTMTDNHVSSGPPGNAETTQHHPAVEDNDILAADNVSDDDASLNRESIASSTTSVTSSVLDYRIENGRTYHRYKDGKYAMPNDEKRMIDSTDRVDLQHNLMLRTFDDRLGTAPQSKKDHKVGRVLDVGTGSGIWAIDFGDEHPEADVSRGHLAPSENANLSPGGYLELNEVDALPISDDGTLTEDCNLKKSFKMWAEGLAALGSPFEKFARMESVLKEAGFEYVHIQRFKWPTNSWIKDSKHRKLGIWNYENLASNLKSMFLASYTRGLGWTKKEVMVMVMKAREDFTDRIIHAYFNICSIYGRKPVQVEEN